MENFTHLHVHSEYSIVDGIVRLKALVQEAKKQGSHAIALTDQCNLFGAIKFYQYAIQANIKPIIGVDVYIENELNLRSPFRLLFLCQNTVGYKNLMRLISRAEQEGKSHSLPLISKSWLKEHHEGLIAIALGQYSDLGKALLEENDLLVETLLEYWSGLFPNRFYLGVSRVGQANESAYIEHVIKLAQRKPCALVALNEVCFLNASDYEAHEARVCIHEGHRLNDPNRNKRYTQAQYLKTPSEMQQCFADIPEALENSVEIAKRCNVELVLNQVFLPNYPVPKSLTVDVYFEQEAKKGLEKRLSLLSLSANDQIRYTQRLMQEITVIQKMGYASYFLIVADFVAWSKKNQIPVGPGRGSGAGSLVAYAMHITGIDPLVYGLLFERFLNPDRVSLPDFDIDFCMEGRDRVIDYVARTYGLESVSQIITYGTMAAKAVIRDVGRILDHPYGFVDKLAKLIPFEVGITLDKALQQEANLKKRYEEEDEVRVLIDLAKKLEGITRNVGKHAGGVVIAPSTLTDYCPLYMDEQDSTIIAQFDKNDIETIGLIKFDFLGLRTLTIIDRACRSINANINIDALALDDLKTFDLLRSGQTTAIFQLESRGMKDLIAKLHPDSFEEIIALVALFRPGPLQSGMVDDFINRKHKRAIVDYSDPRLVPILESTYGVILYQEQVMHIAQVLADYTMAEADLLRRAMGKKKPEEMAKQREKFITGATANGVSKEKATNIFNLMEKFAGYGFNKSHSAAYALLTYQTAWLKTHYSAHFMAAVLSSDMNNTDKVLSLIHECKSLNLRIVLPDINQSQFAFAANEKQEVIYGLGAIKGLGQSAIESMVELRKTSGPYKDIIDFFSRIDLKKSSKKVFEALIKSGALDSLGKHRAWMMHHLESLLQLNSQLNKNNRDGQEDLFSNTLSQSDLLNQWPNEDVSPWSEAIRLQAEKDTLGLYLTGHPIHAYRDELTKMGVLAMNQLTAKAKEKKRLAGFIVALRTLRTKKGDRMAFLTLDDHSARLEVAVFSDIYQAKRLLIEKDKLVILEGEISRDEYTQGLRVRCTDLMDINEARDRYVSYVQLTVNQTRLNESFISQLKQCLDLAARGKVQVQLNYENNHATCRVPLGEKISIRPDEALLATLGQLCGEDNVTVVY